MFKKNRFKTLWVYVTLRPTMTDQNTPLLSLRDHRPVGRDPKSVYRSFNLGRDP